jgi:hypothetical protein
MNENQFFARQNWFIFALGLACIAAGYLFLSLPPVDGPLSLTVAPFLLVLGYCVLIPLALLYKPKTDHLPTG